MRWAVFCGYDPLVLARIDDSARSCINRLSTWCGIGMMISLAALLVIEMLNGSFMKRITGCCIALGLTAMLAGIQRMAIAGSGLHLEATPKQIADWSPGIARLLLFVLLGVVNSLPLTLGIYGLLNAAGHIHTSMSLHVLFHNDLPNSPGLLLLSLVIAFGVSGAGFVCRERSIKALRTYERLLRQHHVECLVSPYDSFRRLVQGGGLPWSPYASTRHVFSEAPPGFRS